MRQIKERGPGGARIENNSHLGRLAAVRLSELPFRTAATVDAVEDAAPIGAEPLLVQVGFTRFALRRREAARISVRVGVRSGAAAAIVGPRPAEVEQA